MTKIAHSIDEVKAAVGLGKTAIYREIKEGRLKSFTVGSRRLIADEDLQNWIKNCRERTQ